MPFGQATIVTEGPGMIPIVSYPGSNPRFSMTESEDLCPPQRLADKNNKNVSSCITNA
jgi:hypothetical protein